ncbi:hypothetical protein K493DRAFT_197362, partial [Basidiobolus meristosporus CBS 931.73]
IFGCGAGIAQGATVFGSNLIYAIGGPDYTNPWGERGVGMVGLLGGLPDRPDLKENFSFHNTTSSVGSHADAIYFVIFAYGGWNILPISVIQDSRITVAANLFNRAFGGIFGSRILPVFVGLSSFGYVGGITFSGSRVILEASRDGYLPFDRVFARSNATLQTPMNSLILLYGISMVFLLAPPPGSVFQFIVAFAGYGSSFFTALSVIGLLLLRFREPNIHRPIRVPIVVALVFILCCFYILAFVFVPPVKKPEHYPYY